MTIRNLFFLLIMTSFWASCGDDEGTTPPSSTPAITINDITTTEGDASLSLSVALTLSEPAASNIIFNYSTVAGTAQPGSDFIALDNEEFVISAGSSSANLFVTILGDNVEENDESFEIAFINPVGATFTNSRVTITIEDNDNSSGNSTIPTTGYTTPDNYPGMTLVWADEFSNNTLSSDWTHETGTGQNGWGNNELQYYRSQNTTFQDGNLIITAKNDGFGGRNYTSSRIITKDKKSFKYGRVDIRAVLPRGQGIWPALWMLGNNFSTAGWPHCGEIDIMELIGHEPSTVYGTVHWQDTGGHADYGGHKTLSSGEFGDEFHVFSIIWDDQKIQWLLDDVSFHVIDITPTTLSEFHQEFFFIFNVAVGGNWPGNPNSTTSFPQRMIVDYIRVFQ